MNQRRQSGFHLWVIIVIIAIIGVIGVLIWRFVAGGAADKLISSVTGSGSEFAQQYECKDRDVSFTSPPMKLEEIGYIRPLGAMLDGHVTPTDHVYVAPIDADVPDNTYEVLMPADGTIVEISRMPDSYIGDREGAQLAAEDHRIVVSFNCRYYSIFIHIHKLADALASQVKGIQPNESRKVSIELKAGDTFGYIGGSSFDWTPVDVEQKLTGFISPDLYKRENWKIHTVSPYDWYTGTLKSQLEAKSWRQTAPIGGKIDYDQPGKLIGTWFRQGTNGYEGSNPERYWDGHLSVVPDYVDPDYSVVSIGNWNGKAQQFAVVTTVLLDEVTASDGIVKLELTPLNYISDDITWNGNSAGTGIRPNLNGEISGTILFEVQDGEKLKVEKFVGKRASEVSGFTSGVEVYER